MKRKVQGGLWAKCILFLKFPLHTFFSACRAHSWKDYHQAQLCLFLNLHTKKEHFKQCLFRAAKLTFLHCSGNIVNPGYSYEVSLDRKSINYDQKVVLFVKVLKGEVLDNSVHHIKYLVIHLSRQIYNEMIKADFFQLQINSWVLLSSS